MPLDNTAKLSDIISALQTMEGINAKADLASVVGSPATSNDTMAAINAVIQQAKNDLAAKLDDGSSNTDPLLELVKKLFDKFGSASGIAVIPSPSVTFKTGSGVTTDRKTITINGLTFRPKTVILTTIEEYSSTRFLTVFNEGNNGYIDSYAITTQFQLSSSNGNTTNFSVGEHIKEDGFTLPLHGNGSDLIGKQCRWIAYGE